MVAGKRQMQSSDDGKLLESTCSVERGRLKRERVKPKRSDRQRSSRRRAGCQIRVAHPPFIALQVNEAGE